MDPLKNDPRLIIGAVFFVGLVWIYLFNKVCDRREDLISQPEESLKQSETKYFKKLLPFLVLLPIPILFFINQPVWPYLCYVGLGFLYSYPLFKGMRLKNVFFVKNLVAGIDMLAPVWFGLIIYFPPYYIAPYEFNFNFFAALFLIYVAGEILWDIRDIKGDDMNNIQTLPVVLGVQKSKVIAIAFVWIAVFFLGHSVVNYFVGIIMSIFIILATVNTKPIFFHLFIYCLSGILLASILWG